MNIKAWSYDHGIQTIQFYIDGIFQGEISRVKRSDIEELYTEYLNMDLGYELSYDISSLSDGSHSLEIITPSSSECEKSQTLKFIVSN